LTVADLTTVNTALPAARQSRRFLPEPHSSCLTSDPHWRFSPLRSETHSHPTMLLMHRKRSSYRTCKPWFRKDFECTPPDLKAFPGSLQDSVCIHDIYLPE
jgi:hypothetical protein